MATLHYPGTPGTALYGGRPKPAPPQPGEGVATTVAVANLSGGALTSAPTTFGFSFPPGAWQPDAHDIHAAVAGAPLTIQTDAHALHPDGSVRFAVVTLDAGAMSAGQTKTIDLTTGAKRAAYTTPLAAQVVPVVAEATVYGVQRTEVICSKGGPAFVAGETVTLRLTVGGVDYDYAHTVVAGKVSGTDVADALSALITAGGMFRARRESEGGGYERITVERMDPLVGGFTASAIYAGPATIVFNTISTFAAPVLWTASLQAELDAQIASSNAGTIVPHRRRLHGPVVSEFRQMVKFKDPGGVEHAFLTAIFDTRIYEDGRQWVDVALENTGLITANPLAINYKLELKVGGTVVFSEPRFWHFAKTRWHKSVWVGGNPALRVTKDMAYFMTTRATPNFNLSFGPSGAALDTVVSNEAAAQSAKSWFGRMACTLLNPAMGTTGGRPEIGIWSEWVYDYYATQDDRAKAMMLKVCDNAGTFSTHYRDEATGFPAGLDTRPDLEASPYNPNVPFSREMIPSGADNAHQGTYGYHPYLATGDAYHLDEMMFWVSWNLINDNRINRFAQGIGTYMTVYGSRGTAWSLRAAMEVCFALPSWHPRLQYYRDQLDANLAHMDTVKGVSWANGPFGILLLNDNDSTDNWQGDFLTCVLGWGAENGVAHTMSIIGHLATYQFGRVLHGADGYCPQWATDSYYPPTKIAGVYATTWNELAQAQGGARYGQACAWNGGVDDGSGDYSSVFRAASAVCADAGNATAAAAHAQWTALTPGLYNASTRKWAIVRRA